MTQILIDRATLEQLVRMLEQCLDDAIQVQCDLEQGYSKSLALAQMVQVELSKEALTAGRVALANAEPAGWQPIETAPKDGKFLIAVWEGDWDNPKRNCTIYQATGFPSGPVWAMRGSYRTEEGGAYKLAGWMPLPTPPKEQQ